MVILIVIGVAAAAAAAAMHAAVDADRACLGGLLPRPLGDPLLQHIHKVVAAGGREGGREGGGGWEGGMSTRLLPPHSQPAVERMSLTQDTLQASGVRRPEVQVCSQAAQGSQRCQLSPPLAGWLA